MGQKSSKKATDAVVPPPDENELRREKLRQLVAEKIRALQKDVSLGQVNIFFMHQYGFNIYGCVDRICKASGVPLEGPEWLPAANERLSGVARTGLLESLHGAQFSGTKGILAELELAKLQHIPHDVATSKVKPLVPVRIFQRSIVEYRWALVPTIMGSISADNPSSDQNLVIGAAESGWAALARDVSVRHSIWVYLRMNDNAWQKTMETAQHNLSQDFYKNYRAIMDAEFVCPIGAFARTHHTLVIDVHSALLDQDDVALDIAGHVFSHIEMLNEHGLWGSPAQLAPDVYLSDRNVSANFINLIGNGCSPKQPARAVISTSESALHVKASIQVAKLRPVRPHSDTSLARTLNV